MRLQMYVVSTYRTIFNDDPTKKCEHQQQSDSQKIPPPIRIVCEDINVHTEEALDKLNKGKNLV